MNPFCNPSLMALSGMRRIALSILVGSLFFAGQSFSAEKPKRLAAPEDREAAFSKTYTIQDIAAQALSESENEVGSVCSILYDGSLSSFYANASGFSRMAPGGGSYVPDVFPGTRNVRSIVLSEFYYQNEFVREGFFVAIPTAAGKLAGDGIFNMYKGNLVPAVTVAQVSRLCADSMASAAQLFSEKDLSSVTSLALVVQSFQAALESEFNERKFGSTPFPSEVRFRKGGAVDWRWSDGESVSSEPPPSLTVTVLRRGRTIYSDNKINNADYKISISRKNGARVIQ